MNIDEARRILGLRPGEDASEHLGEFLVAREQIADLVRMAPNDTIALRYQEGLMEFDRALAAVREEVELHTPKDAAIPATVPPAPAEIPSSPSLLETLVSAPAEVPVPLVVGFVPEATPAVEVEPVPAAPPTAQPAADLLETPLPFVPEVVAPAQAAPPPAPAAVLAEEAVVSLPATELLGQPPPTVRIVPAATTAEVPSGGEAAAPLPRRRFPYGTVAACALLVLLGGGWLWFRMQEDARLQRQGRIAFLERQGAILVENRRWEEAVPIYQEIESLEPGSPLAILGRRSIEAGMAEELNQYFGYWQGEALAAFDAGRWDDAEKAIRMVTAKMPDNREMLDLKRKISQARRERERSAALEKGRKALEANRWEDAAAVAHELLEREAGDREADELLAAANAGRERERENLAKARELVALAKQRDTGAFDEQALEWVREAARLAPTDPEVSALYQKLSGYTRMLRVPEEHATIGAAIAAARPRDRIVVGKGVWQENLLVDRVVEIEGAGPGDTVIESAAGDGPAIVFGAEAVGTRVTGVGFHHTGFAGGVERYSVAVVHGGRVAFDRCRFSDASGHGLAVTDGAVVSATGCNFDGNGWDGVAAYGEGSRAELTDCVANGNFQHGIDAWNGAALAVRNTNVRGNGRNGICVLSPADVLLEGNKAEENREFGIVVAASSGGQVTANQLARNELGGAAFHRAAKGLTIRGNHATRNGGPGLVFDEGFCAAALDNNEVTGNQAPKQVMEGVKLDATAEAIPDSPPPK